MNDLATAPAAPPVTRAKPRKPSSDHPITAHLALVKGIAVRIAHRHRIDLCGMDIEDLVAIGTEALFEAARRFDPTRGASLATFAYYRVQGAMVDALRANGSYRNRVSDGRAEPAERVLVVSLEAHEAVCLALPDERELPDDAVAARCAARRLHAAIARLPDLERRLIEGYYFDDLTLDDLGAKIGTSRSWTCRMLHRAIETLRHALTL